MLLHTIFSIFAAVAIATVYAINTQFEVRETNSTLDAIEMTAHSRLPNIPLPDKISDSTTTLLQFMTIWEQAELSILNGTINAISDSNTTSGPWTNNEVIHILEVAKAEADLHTTYYTQLLAHYSVPLIPTPCTYIDVSTPDFIGILALEQLAALFIDALADATKSLGESGDSALLPIISTVMTSKAQQSGFYRLFNGEFPSERAWLTAIPPALAYSTFLQVIDSCPFDIHSIGLPISGVMFSDWIEVNASRTYCVDLAKVGVPADLNTLSLNIVVGDQVPIVVKPRNVEVNGTVLAFDADFPRNGEILDGMIVAELTKERVRRDVDGLVESSLATTFIQFEEPLVGVGIVPGKADAGCPRAGGNQV